MKHPIKFEGTTTGTSAADYAKNFNMFKTGSTGRNLLTIMLRNTHATYILTYLIRGYANLADKTIFDVLREDEDLDPETTYTLNLADSMYAGIEIFVRSKVAGEDCPFTCVGITD